MSAASQEEAEAIATALVEAKLAACVSFTPMTSIYRWQGAIQLDTEWQLIIKTNLNVFPALCQKIQELHSYEVPEIIALPITAGLPAYLKWIGENVTQSHP